MATPTLAVLAAASLFAGGTAGVVSTRADSSLPVQSLASAHGTLRAGPGNCLALRRSARLAMAGRAVARCDRAGFQADAGAVGAGSAAGAAGGTAAATAVAVGAAAAVAVGIGVGIAVEDSSNG